MEGMIQRKKFLYTLDYSWRKVSWSGQTKEEVFMSTNLFGR
jgi:hypothetical protein